MFKKIFSAIKKCLNTVINGGHDEGSQKTTAIHHTPKTASPSPERDGIKARAGLEAPSPRQQPAKETERSNKTPEPKTHLEITQERAREAIKTAKDNGITDKKALIQVPEVRAALTQVRTARTNAKIKEKCGKILQSCGTSLERPAESDKAGHLKPDPTPSPHTPTSGRGLG